MPQKTILYFFLHFDCYIKILLHQNTYIYFPCNISLNKLRTTNDDMYHSWYVYEPRFLTNSSPWKLNEVITSKAIE